MKGVLLWSCFIRFFAVGLVQLGNEILRNNNYDILHGHRVAILTNPTGVFQDNLIVMSW